MPALLSTLLLSSLLACGGSPAATTTGDDVAMPDASTDPALDAGDAGTCTAPDVLIVLDRTMSMITTPAGTLPENTPAGRATSKWGLAVMAIEALGTLDATIRLGLELFPRDPGGDQCVTIAQKLDGAAASNVRCEPGEVAVEPALATGPEIAGAIDVDTTRLCRSTPIGAALATADVQLAALAAGARAQFVVLVTDGKDACDATGGLTEVQALAARGVLTYAIGFGATGVVDGVDGAQLNRLACAGHTAIGFPAPCTADASGN
ncbi:MAG: VWA domain-containing protein, partial [Proteobacteria bacterium]|nr:VWA domain-containing protein [Pseudomonadota bacterium]